MLGTTFSIPGGKVNGTVYVAAPVKETDKLPAVAPSELVGGGEGSIGSSIGPNGTLDETSCFALKLLDLIILNFIFFELEGPLNKSSLDWALEIKVA
ncbi:hypothetical protein [Lutibacter sp.]|uniref:hypothetical protein n=1 Tax=Lutibacter sp. TaxID=1925666 RepID=UPI0025BFDEF2|nr:hypothetical protein [Lutibacter sp.]MCF6182718.1 hypothetical protein [Lutibacter sp.]